MEVIMKFNLVAAAVGIALMGGLARVAFADNPPSTASAGSASSASRDAAARVGSDEWITSEIRSGLTGAAGVRLTQISVSTTDGVVTLAGMLDTRAQVEKSVSIAKSVQGVRRVDSAGLTSRE
jgi:hyperosmotically inducible protein